jgi:cytochrome P450
VERAIEEVLQYRSSFTQVGRVTMVETELSGQAIPADVVVTPWLLFANRDELEFADPDRFDIQRGGTHHLAFGHSIHRGAGRRRSGSAWSAAAPVGRRRARRAPRSRMRGPPGQSR